MGVVPPQIVNDRGVDAVQIFQHLMVPKPHNAIALVLQETTSLHFLGRRRIVLATIDFDNQTRFVTNKIGNVAAERHLIPA
ncbi:MAG TPA: hypothetical protein VGM07_05025 [Stellaceae bacterium]